MTQIDHSHESAGTQQSARPPRKVTGRTVLVWLVAFFGIIFAVNAWMAYSAIRTFSGVDTENAYRAGLAYDSEIAAADEQRARGWSVDARLTGAEPQRTMEIDVRDRAAVPLTGLSVRARLIHPGDRRRDVEVALTDAGGGAYRGTFAAPNGEREMVIELFRDDKRMFRSQNRVSLH
jgi:nitrogen fixation protein FixH